MKKLLFTLVILAGSLWACEKESQKEISPLEQQKSGRVNALSNAERAAADAMGKLITLEKFNAMTDAYKQKVSPKETRAVAYGATVIEQILAQKGCVGIRSYLAKDDAGRTTIVMIGIDKDGNDITSNAVARTTSGTYAAGDGPLCPSECTGVKR
ncbi:hypothetical protein [Telluribacter sp. SYSU D00476]|uniref:hypothetical protein n=1 Tax=Telluribacter sp. SYSU D00476 TaxID=2811430 RepID=UPI001FF3DC27|nr:hypothetical protein [Telluribacter sp. SYSU D00476]